MISALRKIEHRGDLEGATSGVMEMCIDNPREGFENLFDTHPSVDNRVEALVHFAGGRDPGPLPVPEYDDALPIDDQPEDGAQEPQRTAADGPYGPSNTGGNPFLPQRPPIELGAPSASPSGASDPGPWGPHGGSTR